MDDRIDLAFGTPSTVQSRYFSPVDLAVFLAATAVSHATAYLDGRNDAEMLGRNADQLNGELILADRNPAANSILDPVGLLVTAMLGASVAQGEARQDRWQYAMGALVELVRHECGQHRQPGAQR